MPAMARTWKIAERMLSVEARLKVVMKDVLSCCLSCRNGDSAKDKRVATAGFRRRKVEDVKERLGLDFD